MTIGNDSSLDIPTTEILLIFLQGPICIVGFGLNIINFSVFVKRKYCAAPYVLLSALSIADAITLLLYSIETMAKCQHFSFCKQPYIQLVAYVFAIYAKVPISNITETISCIITVALATERYLAMRHYNFRKIYFTVKNTRLFVLSISIFSTIFNTPFFFTTVIRIDWEYEISIDKHVPVVYSDYASMTNSSFYSAHSWIRAIGIHMLPLLYLCICNSLLLALICHHNKRLETIRSSYLEIPDCKSNSAMMVGCPLSIPNQIRERKQIAQNKLTLLLSIIIFLYLIGQIPSSLAYINIYRTFGSCTGYKYIHECPNYDLYRTITLIMMLTCYVMNFFVYFFLNSHFRKSLYECFDKIFPKDFRLVLRPKKSDCCYHALSKKAQNESILVQSGQSGEITNCLLPTKDPYVPNQTRITINKGVVLAPIIENSEDFSSNLLETFEIETSDNQMNIYNNLTEKRNLSLFIPLIAPLALSESVSFENMNSF